jgi:UDP-N-acetylglucosamine diphosphorylase/glucosamine-1-phosphate N-acetyltransferase
MRVCLFEDQKVRDLEPLVLTRAAFELLCGQDSLADKQCRCFDSPEVGVLIRPHLAPLYRLQHPHRPVNDPAWLRADATILVNARWLPPPFASAFPQCGRENTRWSPSVAMIEDEVAYAIVQAEQLASLPLPAPPTSAEVTVNGLEDYLESWKNTLPRWPAGGCLIRYPWDLIERNAEQLIQDYALTASARPVHRPREMPALVGRADHLLIDPTARLDPLVVADTTSGPVIIDREAVIAAFSRLEGPCYIGPRTHVLGAKIRAGTTLGPDCRVGGEVEASIIQGKTNKYHDGFLGHSYVGEWVNLGAGTQSSDLRNDYGEVTVTIGGRPVATGLHKVGCFLGDHTKTGLGTLLNTGTTAGVFCNLLPCGRLLPRYFPSFSSCWNGTLAENANLPQLLQTAREVMRRRGATLTDVHAELFRYLFNQSVAERQRILREEERRPLRKSA